MMQKGAHPNLHNKSHILKTILPTAEATQQNDGQEPSSGGKMSEFSGGHLYLLAL